MSSPKLGVHLQRYLKENTEPQRVEVSIIFKDPILIPMFAGRSRGMALGLQRATEEKFADLIAEIRAIAIGQVPISWGHITVTLETTFLEALTAHPDVALIGLAEDRREYEEAEERRS